MCHTKECPYEDEDGRCKHLYDLYRSNCAPSDAACMQREKDFEWTRSHLIWEQKNRKEKHK